MSGIKEGRCKPRLCVSVNQFAGVRASILRDSVAVAAAAVVVIVVVTTRKSTHGFPLLSYIAMGLHLAAFRAAGALL